MDRTARNTNMLMWHQQLWLIDHGASLYFHHSWQNWEEQAAKPFLLIKDHVLLPQAAMLDQVNEAFSAILSPAFIQQVVNLIPDEWLETETSFDSPSAHRNAYAYFLNTRIANASVFVNQAKDARAILI